jgi:hypothetical protein
VSLKEKIRIIWDVLKARGKVIVFNPEGVYGNAVMLHSETPSDDELKLAKELLLESLEHIIPSAYAKERNLRWHESVDYNKHMVVSVKSYPPGAYYDLVTSEAR